MLPATTTSMVLKEQILEVMEGPHVAAMATIAGALPAVRFMVLNGTG